MDRYTQETCRWLELRFHPDFFAHHGRPYEPYQPLFGAADGTWGPAHFLMASRMSRLLAQLRAIQPASFLDVGGAEGWVARLVQDEIGIPTASVDLSHQAAIRAREYCQIPSAAVDSAQLPFRDKSFDVVFLSEVLEHLANPVRSLLELSRVAKRAVIVTTEAFAPSEAERQTELDEREFESHMDRSIFCPQDFDLVFKGQAISRGNQCCDLPNPYPENNAAAREALHEFMSHDALDWPAHGIVVVASTEGIPPDPQPFLAESIDTVARWYAPQTREPLVPESNEVPPFLLERLCCPVTGSIDARVEGEHLVFGDRRYLVEAGAPRLMTDPGEAYSDTLEERIRAHFPGDEDQAAALTTLAEKLSFELPAPDPALRFLETSCQGWESEGCQLEVLEGQVEVLAPTDDPQLVSPRILHPMAAVSGFVIEVAALDSNQEVEEIQVYWKTLQRPVWMEAMSLRASYPVDGQVHRLELKMPTDFEHHTEDELLQLRLDPLRGSGRARLLLFELVLGQ